MDAIINILTDKKKKNIILIVLFILFVILMINSHNKNDNAQKDIINNQNIQITPEIKNELTRKIKLLKYSNYCEISTTTSNYMYDCLYRKQKTKISDLSEQYKIYVLILSLDSLNKNKDNYIVGTITLDNMTFDKNTQFINLSTLQEEYNNLYGKSDNFIPSTINTISKYPYVKYDKTKRIFYYQTNNKENEFNTTETIEYINKYESDKENIYVYVSVAFVSQNTNSTMGIYSDYLKSKLIQTIEISNYNKNNIINNNNYNKFSNYKYTFIKDDKTNNLIFKEVEIVQ